jgi:hypothetical protein
MRVLHPSDWYGRLAHTVLAMHHFQPSHRQVPDPCCTCHVCHSCCTFAPHRVCRLCRAADQHQCGQHQTAAKPLAPCGLTLAWLVRRQLQENITNSLKGLGNHCSRYNSCWHSTSLDAHLVASCAAVALQQAVWHALKLRFECMSLAGHTA